LGVSAAVRGVEGGCGNVDRFNCEMKCKSLFCKGWLARRSARLSVKALLQWSLGVETIQTRTCVNIAGR